jgi:hypothetical protein
MFVWSAVNYNEVNPDPEEARLRSEFCNRVQQSDSLNNLRAVGEYPNVSFKLAVTEIISLFDGLYCIPHNDHGDFSLCSKAS